MICEHKVSQALGIIYPVTPWVILFSVKSKSTHQSKQNPIIGSDILRRKFEVLKLLC